jgi:SAM-dependent methyltransferase
MRAMSRLDIRPPSPLSSRIGGADADYETIGGAHAQMIRTSLPEDWDWSGRRILDFGCGTGRTLVQFREEAARAEFWGCDIDVPSIDWAAENLSPPFHFVVNEELPPTPLESGSFDLIYGMSVFTHLVETWSVWLLEMHRLLNVGGLGLFTFLGEGMIGDITGRAWDENRVGMVGLDVGRPWNIGGPNVLHSEWWLREHWGRAFDVVAVRRAEGHGHSLILIRRRGGAPPSEDELRRIEPGDAREIASLEFTVELLHERSRSLWRTETGELLHENNQLRHELDGLIDSLSWKITKPLRGIRSRLRAR